MELFELVNYLVIKRIAFYPGQIGLVSIHHRELYISLPIQDDVDVIVEQWELYDFN